MVILITYNFLPKHATTKIQYYNMILRYHGPTIFSMSIIKRGLCFRKIKIKKKFEFS